MSNDRPDLGVMFSFRNPAQWRRPFTDVYRDELELIVQAERLGYDTIWLTEHHFADDGYSPSIVPLAAAIAARTERVRIGFNLLLLPLHDPVPLAEAIATLDVLSGGRIDIGVGQGYALHEFAGFGIPVSERLQRFREGLDVLVGLLTNESFSYDGVHHRVSDARLSPRPVQEPMPPLWIGATSRAGVRRAGRRGAHLLGVTSRTVQQVYDDARADAGFDVDGSHALQIHWTHIGADDDQAWDEALPHYHHLVSVYAGWLESSDNPAGKVTVPALEDMRDHPPVLFDPAFGSADTVAAKIKASMERIRTTHIAIGTLPGMDPAVTLRSLEEFMSQVAPTLR